MARSLVAASAVVLALFIVLRVEAVNNGKPCVNHADCVKNAFCWNKVCNCGYGYGTSTDKTECKKLLDTCAKDDDCKGTATCKVVASADIETTPRVCVCPAGWTGFRCEARIVTGTLGSGVEFGKAKGPA